MIVSAVADPSAFGPEGITDELSKREAIAFLRGILDNGLLLDEPTRALLRKALNEVVQLSTNLGQRIRLLLEEIQKNHKKYVVTCDRTTWANCQTPSGTCSCSAIASLFQADAVVTHPGNREAIQQQLDNSIEVVLVAEVTESKFDERRRKFLRIENSIDKISATDLEELIGRAVKYASTLRFFDYRMIGSVQRTEKYLAGMHFVVAVWEKWCVIGEPNSRTVEIYTVGNTYTQRGFVNASEANGLLRDHIQKPLCARVGAVVRGFVKEDLEPRIFHARGFEAKRRAYTIDPGFDAIGTAGPVRRCLLKHEPAAEEHFMECRKLEGLP